MSVNIETLHIDSTRVPLFYPFVWVSQVANDGSTLVIELMELWDDEVEFTVIFYRWYYIPPYQSSNYFTIYIMDFSWVRWIIAFILRSGKRRVDNFEMGHKVP